MATTMLRFLRKMIARLGLAGAVVLALAVAAPAFAAHACINESCAPSGQTSVQAPADADDACPDCGPACANGCCHAPHVSTPVTMAPPLCAPHVARSQIWLDQTALPLIRPAGPDRPPRA